MSQKRLFLLDAYALIFRGYFAFIKNPELKFKFFHKARSKFRLLKDHNVIFLSKWYLKN